MSGRIFLGAGGWPGLVFLLLLHLNYLGTGPAVSLALAYGVLFLLIAQRAGKTDPLAYGLTFFYALLVMGVGPYPLLGEMLLGRFFFFGLYSSLFLSSLVSLWLRIFSPEGGITGAAGTARRPRIVLVIWACLCLASALSSLWPGMLFKVGFPAILLLVVGRPLTAHLAREAQPEETDEPLEVDLLSFGETPEATGPGFEGEAEASALFTLIDESQMAAETTLSATEAALDQPGPGPGPAPAGKPEPAQSKPAPKLSPSPAAVLTPVSEAIPYLGPVEEALVLQGSPRGAAGMTELILDPFVAGLKSAKVAVEVVYLRDVETKPCQGCFDCWTKTPGLCRHKDGAVELIERLTKTDLVVLATPLILGGLSGLTRTFLDRCLPLWEPWLVAHPKGGTFRSPRAGRLLGRRAVLLTTGALPEKEAFQALVKEVEAVLRLGQEPLVGRLIRPAGDLLRLGPRLGPSYQAAMQALYSAGAEVARLGRASPETEAQIRAPLFKNAASFRMVTNLYWEVWQEYYAAKRAGVELPEFEPFIDRDVRLNLATSAMRYDLGRAKGWQGSCQFNVSGRQPGQWYLMVKDDACGFHEGWTRRPDLILHLPSETLVALVRGELDPKEGLEDGLFRVEGQTALLNNIKEAFGWGTGLKDV